MAENESSISDLRTGEMTLFIRQGSLEKTDLGRGGYSFGHVKFEYLPKSGQEIKSMHS